MAADTSVKLFDSTMTGAPTMPSTPGAIIAVLDACLKDGFGLKSVDSIVVTAGVATANISTGHSAKTDVVMLIAGSGTAALNGEKRTISANATAFTFDATGVPDGTYTGAITCKVAPAGWVKPFSGTNLAAYKSNNPAATGHLFRFDDSASGTYDARWFGCETMTDINTWTGKFPTDVQQSGGMYMTRRSGNTGNSPWWIIADDRTVYIGIAFYTASATDFLVHAFGDFASRKSPDQYRSFISSQNSTQTGGYPSAEMTACLCNVSSSQSAMYCPRSYTQIGNAVQLSGKMNATTTGVASGLNSFPFPNPTDNSLIFDNQQLFETTGLALRGKMPGILSNLQNVAGQITDSSVLPAIPGFPSRKFLWKILGSTNSGTRGGFAIDVTGPWEH